jgi:hypothetical protein
MITAKVSCNEHTIFIENENIRVYTHLILLSKENISHILILKEDIMLK